MGAAGAMETQLEERQRHSDTGATLGFPARAPTGTRHLCVASFSDHANKIHKAKIAQDASRAQRCMPPPRGASLGPGRQL